jgi:hypothetical protein
VADAAGEALEEPDVRAGRGQLDVAEALAAHLGLCDLDAALVADDAAVLHPLVLAAEALPVGDGAEDARAEEAVALGLERAVVDRLRLRHLAVRPLANLLRRRQRDADRLEVGRELRLLLLESEHRFYLRKEKAAYKGCWVLGFRCWVLVFNQHPAPKTQNLLSIPPARP